MKTIKSSYDLNQEDILDILQKTRKVENGEGKDLDRKILGIFNYNPSIRTSTALAHSIIKSGGNYISIDNYYLKDDVEDLEDTVKDVSNFIDVLAVRTNSNIPINELKPNVPVLNAMCGDEHTLSGIYLSHSILQRTNKVTNEIKIGIYGQTKFSETINALYRIGGKLGFQFFENTVCDGVGSYEIGLENEIYKHGGRLKVVEELPEDLDFLIISEGSIENKVDEILLRKFLNAYNLVNDEFYDSLKSSPYLLCIEPRSLPDGRLTMTKEMDEHPKMINQKAYQEMIYVNQGIFEWILE